jgi:hypothetical protein
MPGLDPGIHVLTGSRVKDVDGRDEARPPRRDRSVLRAPYQMRI